MEEEDTSPVEAIAHRGRRRKVTRLKVAGYEQMFRLVRVQEEHILYREELGRRCVERTSVRAHLLRWKGKHNG